MRQRTSTARSRRSERRHDHSTTTAASEAEKDLTCIVSDFVSIPRSCGRGHRIGGCVVAPEGGQLFRRRPRILSGPLRHVWPPSLVQAHLTLTLFPKWTIAPAAGPYLIRHRLRRLGHHFVRPCGLNGAVPKPGRHAWTRPPRDRLVSTRGRLPICKHCRQSQLCRRSSIVG